MTLALVVALGVQALTTPLLVGVMVVVEWTLVPAQNRLDGRAYAVLEQGMNRVLTRLTPALMVSAAASGGVATWLSAAAGLEVWPLLATATAGIAVMIASTVVINAPVNAAIDTWDPDALPADWRDLRDRWERGHRLRSYVGLLALVLLLLGLVLPVAG